MSFQRSSESVVSKLHMSHVQKPALVGVFALALGCIACASWGLFAFMHKPSFDVESHGAQSIAAVEKGESGQAEHDDDPALRQQAAQEDDGRNATEQDAAARQDVSRNDARLKVHVVGAVRNPGVYELHEGDRAQDAVQAAGGLLDTASEGSVNLAQALQDGQQLYVPTKKEAKDAGLQPAATQGVANQGSAANQPSAEGTSPSVANKVNINTADAASLETLSGVGPKTAQAIIDERENNGPFASLEDIQRVSGIGEKKFENIKNDICI